MDEASGEPIEPFSIYEGDCVEVMQAWADESVDAVVTDPPYGLEFMGKNWDRLDTGLPQEAVWRGRHGLGGAHVGTDDTLPSSRHHIRFGAKKRGFERCLKCGKRRFSGSPCKCAAPEYIIEYAQMASSGMIRMQRWHHTWATEALRVLKPGGYLLAFGGTRTFHRLACAIEDAGFEIRDALGLLGWVYASGFPKSMNVAKAVGKTLGVDHVVSEDVKQWCGFGTSLKPAFEPIVVARKPLIGTVAENVLKYGTGTINIDGCRVATTDNLNGGAYSQGGRSRLPGDEREGAAAGMFAEGGGRLPGQYEQPLGRFPPNLVLTHHPDCGEECVKGCPVREVGHQSGERKAGGTVRGTEPSAVTKDVYGAYARVANKPHNDTGTAARFFPCFKYQAKASTRERNLGMPEGTRNNHPTLKPLELMRWLVRLVTPPDGLVLDPFLGSGTTAMACELEGFRWVGIEREREYIDIAEQRIRWAAQEAGRLKPPEDA